MNARRFFPLALAATLLVPQHSAGQCMVCPCPVGTAFTYQGFLTCTNNAGNPVIVDGDYGLQFALFNCNVGDAPVGPILTFDGVGANPPLIEVTDGHFSVQLDFGNVYDGNQRWLEITILTAPGPCVGANVILTPRRELTAGPYAIFAPNPVGNTLDQAYDQGGAGAGRTITADVGAVNIAGANGLTVAGPIQSGNSIIIDGSTDTITAMSGTISFGNENLTTAGEIISTGGGFRFPDATVQTTAANAGSAVPVRGIIMWSGSIDEIPTGWALCDGENETPDLRNRFILGTATGEEPGATGGTANHTHTLSGSFGGSHSHLTASGVNNGNNQFVRANPWGTGNVNSNAEVFIFFDGVYDNANPSSSYQAYRTSPTSHSHSFDADTQSHIPTFFKLAFIMKRSSE